MLKIVHVQLLPFLTGVQNVSLKEIEFLNKDFEFHAVCKNEGPFSRSLNEISVPVFEVNSLQREISLRKDLASLRALFSHFKKMNFDIVHTHSSKTGFIGRVAAKLSGCPAIIHTVHGFSFPAAKSKASRLLYFWMEWIAKFCTDKLIVMNHADQEFAIKKLGYHQSKVVFLANGVDLQVFKPPAKKRLFNSTSNLKVVMVGRLWEQKDPRTLLRAAIEVLNQDSRFEFDFIGDGDYLSDLQAEASRSGFSQQIRFLGWQTNVPQRLGNYDLFVLPSKWEGMPLAILEAFACGLPVIASDIPGNQDLVSDGKDGFLFEVGHVAALAERLLTYRNDESLVVRHGQNAREKVEKNYDISRRHQAIAKIYDTLKAN